MSNRHLKHFANTDGLLKGTALVSNLITTACISILPGFGAAGLFIANTVQMTVSGLLEIPTGYLADRFGWSRSVKLAIVLKMFVTLSFLAAVIAARQNSQSWIWIFVTAEALVDSFACAFLSGAYQSAYLKWYETANKKNVDDGILFPPLFLSSFRHGLMIRFAMPLLVMVAILLLNLLSRHFGVVDPYAVAFISIAIIFTLRTLVLLRVFSDLKNIENVNNKHGQSPAVIFDRGLWGTVIHSAQMPLYITVVAIGLFSIFFLIAQVFKQVNASGIPESFVWATGILLGISIYMVKTFLGVLFFPRLAVANGNNSVLLATGVLATVLAVGGIALTFNSSPWLQLPVLLFLAIAASTLAEAIQHAIDSQLSEIVEERMRATWLSIANAFGMLLFGILSYLIIRFELIREAPIFFCLTYFVCLSVSGIRLGITSRKKCLPRFSTVVGRMLVKSIALLMALFFIMDVFNFSRFTLQLQKSNESTVSKMVLNALQEPLLQGSFIEANRRLQVLKDDGSFLCAKLKAWDFHADLCDPNLTSHLLKDEVNQPIYLSESSGYPAGVPVGNVLIYFDRVHLWKSIISRILLSVVFFTACAFGLLYVLRKLGAQIEKELVHVARLVEDDSGVASDAKSEAITIHEFSLIVARLKESFRLKKEMSRNTGMVQLATQLSHDIRSPLAAIEIVFHEDHSLNLQQRGLITAALERIREIADPLLVKHREQLSTEPVDDVFENLFETKTSISAQDLLKVINQLLDEARVQYRNSGLAISLTLNTSFEQASTQLVPSHFKRIISNLLANAIDATHKKGAIHFILDGDDQGFLTISIADDGVGIPKHVLQNIGNRGASYGKKDGNGLGIWYAKKIIESWGGQIFFDSKEGVGTTVRIRLPTQL